MLDFFRTYSNFIVISMKVAQNNLIQFVVHKILWSSCLFKQWIKDSIKTSGWYIYLMMHTYVSELDHNWFS